MLHLMYTKRINPHYGIRLIPIIKAHHKSVIMKKAAYEGSP